MSDALNHATLTVIEIAMEIAFPPSFHPSIPTLETTGNDYEIENICVHATFDDGHFGAGCSRGS